MGEQGCDRPRVNEREWTHAIRRLREARRGIGDVLADVSPCRDATVPAVRKIVVAEADSRGESCAALGLLHGGALMEGEGAR